MKPLVTLLLIFTIFPKSIFADTIEELFGYTTSEKGITFQVQTNGCTTKSNFKILTQEGDPVEVYLIRLIQDPCLADPPYGLSITFDWKELPLRRGEYFSIKNKLSKIRVFY